MHFSFVQITDHHLQETETTLTAGYSTAHALRVTLRHLAEHVAASVDFVVSTGDLVETTTPCHHSRGHPHDEGFRGSVVTKRKNVERNDKKDVDCL